MRVGPDGTGGNDANPRIIQRGSMLPAPPVEGPARQETPVNTIPAAVLRRHSDKPQNQ